MAVVYAVSEFTDENGTDWKVKIVDGSISTGDLNHPFVLGPDGFRLNYAFDNFDRAKPIVGSKVELTLFHPDDNDAAFNTLYAALDTSPEGTYRIEIYRDPDSSNEIWWVGEILPEQTIIPDAFPHAAVSITAVDGLGNLKGIDYNNDGSAYTGSDRITAHLYNCLSKVHSSNFWGASDLLCSFFEDFVGKEYKDHIAGGAQQQLKNAYVEHNTFYNLDREGAKKYFSAYDVLESLALAFNSCVFMAQGRFWFVPLGNIQGHAAGNLNISHEIQGGGLVLYHTSTNVDFAAAFGNNSADFEKLAGWERTSSPAFKEVKRVRDYQGDKPILGRMVLATGTMIQDEDASRPAGQVLLLDGRLKYQTGGITGYTGINNYARLKLSVTLRVGDAGGTSKYLSRAVTFSDSSVYTLGGGTIQLPQYTDPTWETSSASRYEIITPLFFITNGMMLGPDTLNTFLGDTFNFVTPPLLADADGVQLEFDIAGIDYEGNTVAAWTDTSNDVTYQMEGVGLFIYDNENYQQFGRVEIKSTNALDARYTMDQSSSLIGDRISFSDLGTIKVYNGTTNVDSTEWTSLQSSTSSLSINGLGVRERLAANKLAQRIERGTLFQVQKSKFLHPYSILTNSDEGATYYQITSLSFTASRCEFDIECMFLSRDINDITLAQDNGKPSKGDPWPTIGFESKGPSVTDDTVLEANSTKLASVTTDTHGITDLKVSTGSGTYDLSLPIGPATSGHIELLTIRDNGNILKLNNGTAGQVLVSNGTTASFQKNKTGWHGSDTRIKILPRDFVANDVGRPIMVEDDNILSSELHIQALNNIFAYVPIPTGFKATHVKIFGSNTGRAFTTYEGGINTKTITSKGIATFIGSEANITDTNSNTSNYLVIKVDIASSSDEIYGGYVTIALI
tara:strand:+ start:615 stop:3329 length:2715 start_codon:yes stop_codon:yes gene_type:complete